MSLTSSSPIFNKLSDDDITELCKAVEIYQQELNRAEAEIKDLKMKLHETSDKMKLYEELEETLLQLDTDLTSCKQTLTNKNHECNELQKENYELKGIIRTTTDCLEELHRSKARSPGETGIDAEIRRQLEDNETKRVEQEKQLKSYECQMRNFQDLIEQLQSENEMLRTKVAQLESSNRATSPINLIPRNKPGRSENSLQRKTPPRSARRLLQSSTSLRENTESPRLPTVPSPAAVRDTRRHSSYTTGDYVVSYAMRQHGDSTKNCKVETTEEPQVVITPQRSAKPQALVTHPYYPHSPAASTLWQEAIAQEKPYDPTIELSPARDSRASDLRARRSRHSFEDRTKSKVDSPDQASQDLLYSPLESSPRVDSSPIQPQFTQPRIMHPSQVSTIAESYQKPNPHFTVKRNLDEELEGRSVGNSRWKFKGLQSTKIAPARLPSSTQSNSQRSLSTSYSGEHAITDSDAPVKGTFRYKGASVPPKSEWQAARVQSTSDTCMSLSQLPSDSKFRHFTPKTRTSSESSDEHTKSKTLEPSDESDHDRDFEIEGNEVDDDCDDDNSVKVEIGGYRAISKQPSRRNHRFIDLGNITLDCD